MKRAWWIFGVVAAVAMTTVRAAVVDVTFLGNGYVYDLPFERFEGLVLKTNAGQLRIDIDGFQAIAYCVDKFHPAGTGPMVIEDLSSLNPSR